MAELSESHRQIVDQSVNFEDFAFHLYLIKRGLGTILYLYNMQCSNAGHLRIMVFIFLMNWTECSNLLLLAGSWEYVAAIHLCFPTVCERMHFILGIYTQ